MNEEFLCDYSGVPYNYEMIAICVYMVKRIFIIIFAP